MWIDKCEFCGLQIVGHSWKHMSRCPQRPDIDGLKSAVRDVVARTDELEGISRRASLVTKDVEQFLQNLDKDPRRP